MKTYRYMGYDFRATEYTYAATLKPLYEIDDMKPAGTRPFITSIAQCREFIRDSIEAGYYLDGTGTYHDVKRRQRNDD